MYPERKPIYNTYKAIIKEIIERSVHTEFAEAEIDALDRELLGVFREIRAAALLADNKSNQGNK